MNGVFAECMKSRSASLSGALPFHGYGNSFVKCHALQYDVLLGDALRAGGSSGVSSEVSSHTQAYMRLKHLMSS